MTPITPTLGDILAAVLASSCITQDRYAERAQYLSGRALADQTADAMNEGADRVWDSLCSVPDNMLVMLESPEGWTALAAYLAEDLGRAAPTYAPTIH